MKKICLILFFLLISCQKEKEIVEQAVIPKTTSEIDSENKGEVDFKLNIILPSNYKAKQVFNFNVNDNSNYYSNQLIIAKKDGADGLSVMFVEAKSDKNAFRSNNEDVFFLSWERTIATEDVSTLDFFNIDMDKDGNDEFVFIGKDKNKNDVVDVLKYNKKSQEYENIFSKAIKGMIKIEEDEITKDNFQLDTFEDNPDNNYDLKIYKINNDSNKMELFSESIIKKESILKQYGDNKISANLWIKTNEHTKYIMSFEENLEHLVIFKEDEIGKVQEEYKILNYIRSKNRYIFYLENNFIDSSSEKVDISIQDDGYIVAVFKENRDFDGKYGKFENKDIKENVQSKNSQIVLNGIYTNNKDLTFIFANDNTYVMRDKKKQIKGTYLIYKINKDIIDLQTVENRKIERKTYVIEYSEEEEDGVLIKKIKLTPTLILQSGAEETSVQDILELQQVITNKKTN